MAVFFLRNIPTVKTPTGRYFRCRSDCGETGISLYLREGLLEGDSNLKAFHCASRLPSGDLPAVWSVEKGVLTKCGLSVEPKADDEHPFGQLHYETTRCPTDEEADRLALKVTLGNPDGPLLPFVRHHS